MAHATTRVRHVYLVRHAIAEQRGPAWPDDRLRPLSPEGIGRMKEVVGGLAAIGVEIDAILTSPLVRAAETAAILARGLPVRRTIEVPELAPGTLPEATMRAAARATDVSSCALVGHEPDLGALAAWLIGAREPIAFKKGGVCRIDVPDWPATRRSRLIWFATPKMLRTLRAAGGGRRA